MPRLGKVYTPPQYSDRYVTPDMKRELTATGELFFIEEVTEQPSKHGEVWELLVSLPNHEKPLFLLLGKHGNRNDKMVAIQQAIKDTGEPVGPVQYSITPLADGTEWHDIIDPEDPATQVGMPF